MLNRNNLNFVVLLGLFFGWGFVTCLNDLLTPILKQLFALNQFEANFVAFAFFTAYFIGSLFYALSSMVGITFFVRLGYKGLVLLGLVLSGLGCLIFIPAAMLKSYPIFLVGLFSIGFGFTFLQISANPLVLISGDSDTGASRLNLAGGFNSLATTLAPIIGVIIFYDLLDVNTNHANLKYPYIMLALFFLALLGLMYKFLNTNEEHTFSQESGKPYALNHANLLFGALAIFFYVGSEVSVGTNLITYLKSSSTVGLSDHVAGKLLAFYWGGAMIGRFLGGFALGKTSFVKKIVYMLIIAAALTWLIMFLTNIDGIHVVYYIGFQAVALLLFLCSKDSRINLILFSIVNIVNLILGATLHNGWFAAWAILSVGIFNSVMWPNIFDLAIDGLGKLKEQGSSFLVMMILGGAIMPVIQGHIADKFNIEISFLIPVVGYIYILGYGMFYSKKKFNFIK
jgi:FHS family L-fucose permease-like MFS transporter